MKKFIEITTNDREQAIIFTAHIASISPTHIGIDEFTKIVLGNGDEYRTNETFKEIKEKIFGTNADYTNELM